MNQELATRKTQVPVMADEIERVLVGGDLSKLTAEQWVSYYNAVCNSLNLNPLTQPFSYLNLSGKLTLYARKDCTEQLRTIHGISLKLPAREVIDGVYVVTAAATKPDGRHDESTGAVLLENLNGEAKANAMMKAETKAKRRVTLSICGLGMLDESELDSIPGAKDEPIDTGDYRIGTQAAADYVAQQKIANAQRQQKTTTAKTAQAGLPESATPGNGGNGATVPSRVANAQQAKAEILPDDVAAMWALMVDQKSCFEVLAGLKKSIEELAGSDVPYRDILGKHGCKNAGELIKGKGRNFVRQVARELLEYVQRCQKAVNEPAQDDLGITDADIPEVLGGTWKEPQQAALLEEEVRYGD